jgi:hypothetical protein
MNADVSVSREVGATPDRVWGLVADLPRMGEWSNENVGGRWRGDATGPAPGARFRGANRNGIRRWSTNVVVTEATPGRRFAFRVTSMGIPISEWSYEVEPADGGCRVTESWCDARPGWFKPVARLATGVADRVEHTRAGMTLTLERLAAAAEGEATVS